MVVVVLCTFDLVHLRKFMFALLLVVEIYIRVLYNVSFTGSD
jgi:hypothetical protein